MADYQCANEFGISHRTQYQSGNRCRTRAEKPMLRPPTSPEQIMHQIHPAELPARRVEGTHCGGGTKAKVKEGPHVITMASRPTEQVITVQNFLLPRLFLACCIFPFGVFSHPQHSTMSSWNALLYIFIYIHTYTYILHIIVILPYPPPKQTVTIWR